jgi:hypothetical protein
MLEFLVNNVQLFFATFRLKNLLFKKFIKLLPERMYLFMIDSSILFLYFGIDSFDIQSGLVLVAHFKTPQM